MPQRRHPANRRYNKPHYDLEQVRALAEAGRYRLTGKAGLEVRRDFPPDIEDHNEEIRAIIADLQSDEFEFNERRTIRLGGTPSKSVVDVYQIEFEKKPYWIKIKIEQVMERDLIIVISCHFWDKERDI